MATLAPVIPVLVIHDASIAADLAAALIAGGLPALEVTLRTPAALDAIAAMSRVPGGRVGAGTLLTPADVIAAHADVVTGFEARATLAHDDVTGQHLFATVLLDATELRIAIATVPTCALTLLMCHRSTPQPENHLRRRFR